MIHEGQKHDGQRRGRCVRLDWDTRRTASSSRGDDSSDPIPMKRIDRNDATRANVNH